MTQRANNLWVWCLVLTVASLPAFGQDQNAVTFWGERAKVGKERPVGGNGFKVGEGRLHLTFDFETRFDSAAGYFLTAPGVVSPDLSGEALLHLRPGLNLEMPGSRLALDLRGFVDYVHYTGLITPGSTNTSHLEGEANLNVTYNKDAPVEVMLEDYFARSDQTRLAALGTGVLSLYNEARLSVPLRPGGGAVQVTPVLAWATERFTALGALSPVGCSDPECDPSMVETFDYSNVRAGVEARWRFLPKTAIVVDSSLSARNYIRSETPDALILRARAGLSGLVTPKISATATVGWSQNFDVQRGTVIAQLEGNYMMSQTANVKVGYARTLEPVAEYGLFRNDRAYTEAQALLGGRLSARGMAAFDHISFQGDRRDKLLKLDIGPQYQLERWLVLGAGYLLGMRSSSQPGAGINYSRHEGYVRMTVMY